MSPDPLGPDVRVVRAGRRDWRVVCDLHGELARYRSFWIASRDCDQHRESCELRNGPRPASPGRGPS